MPLASQEVADAGRILSLPHPIASDIMGMGSWRLRDRIDPSIKLLVTRIEGTWRELMRAGGGEPTGAPDNVIKLIV